MADKKPNDGLVKLQKAEDAKKAMAEYHAAAAAVDANTARLRALRLERDAAAGSGSRRPFLTRLSAFSISPVSGGLRSSSAALIASSAAWMRSSPGAAL